jgi:hypothetical protein
MNVNKGGDTDGLELSTLAKQRCLFIREDRLQRLYPHLAAKWRPCFDANHYATLSVPSNLFADCLADALTGQALDIRERLQFTYYCISCLLRQEAIILQCERFIALHLSPASVLYALQHATRAGRAELVRLAYHWLRRGGNLQRGLYVNVGTGLLMLENEAFPLAALAPLVAAERARKRSFYLPPEMVKPDGTKFEPPSKGVNPAAAALAAPVGLAASTSPRNPNTQSPSRDSFSPNHAADGEGSYPVLLLAERIISLHAPLMQGKPLTSACRFLVARRWLPAPAAATPRRETAARTPTLALSTAAAQPIACSRLMFQRLRLRLTSVASGRQ